MIRFSIIKVTVLYCVLAMTFNLAVDMHVLWYN
jgi:hypothetical protein